LGFFNALNDLCKAFRNECFYIHIPNMPKHIGNPLEKRGVGKAPPATKSRWIFSFQEFQQLVLAATNNFSAAVPCDIRIGFKPFKNSSRSVAENFPRWLGRFGVGN